VEEDTGSECDDAGGTDNERRDAADEEQHQPDGHRRDTGVCERAAQFRTKERPEGLFCRVALDERVETHVTPLELAILSCRSQASSSRGRRGGLYCRCDVDS
jgi:hypothetical protein